MKVTVTVSPGAIFGIFTPSAGCAPSCWIPFIVTESGIKVVLGGIALVKVIFVAGVFPVFVIVVVYVSVSPTEIIDLSTLFWLLISHC